MTAEEFVTKLTERVIDNDNKIYQNLLETTFEAKDPIWQGILLIYKNSSDEQRVAFLEFLRLIQVNTMSHILGVLDGSTNITSGNAKFMLTIGNESEAINGDLQSIFLSKEVKGGLHSQTFKS